MLKTILFTTFGTTVLLKEVYGLRFEGNRLSLAPLSQFPLFLSRNLNFHVIHAAP